MVGLGGTGIAAATEFALEALFPPAEARRWLDTSQPQLDGSPRDLMLRGEAQRVLRILTRLEQGIPT